MWHLFLEPKVDLSAAQLDALQAAIAQVAADTPAACPAEEVLGDTVVTAQAGGRARGDETVALVCKAPTGARTTNRAIQPVNGRTVMLSTAA